MAMAKRQARLEPQLNFNWSSRSSWGMWSDGKDQVGMNFLNGRMITSVMYAPNLLSETISPWLWPSKRPVRGIESIWELDFTFPSMNFILLAFLLIWLFRGFAVPHEVETTHVGILLSLVVPVTHMHATSDSPGTLMRLVSILGQFFVNPVNSLQECKSNL